MIATEIRYAEPVETIRRPLAWQLAGRTYTASGYGARIPSERMVRLAGDAPGRFRRVYVTRYSNAGSAWVTVRGERLYLR